MAQTLALGGGAVYLLHRRGWGVSLSRRIVIYDGDGTMWAARIFFDLVQLGYPAHDIALLDGGLAKWTSVGGAVTRAVTPSPARGSFTALPPREDMLARLPEVLVATGEPQRVTAVHALTPEYHCGARQYFGRGGHLPPATCHLPPATCHLPSCCHIDFFNEARTFKSPSQLRQMLDHQGLTADLAAITHCGGGVAAAVPFFAMKYLMGHRDVKLYRGSQLEWLRNDRSLPMWTYAAPYLLRDIDWLKTWGQGFLRQMGMVQVQPLDLRADSSAAGRGSGSCKPEAGGVFFRLVLLAAAGCHCAPFGKPITWRSAERPRSANGAADSANMPEACVSSSRSGTPAARSVASSACDSSVR